MNFICMNEFNNDDDNIIMIMFSMCVWCVRVCVWCVCARVCVCVCGVCVCVCVCVRVCV